MSKALTLSIIIPAFNEEHQLPACLQAIAKQTVKPDEVIVVDNNSVDHTVAIANRYSFVKVITAPQQGIVYARNRGFDAARSNFIGRIDADTILPPDWVAQIKTFYADPAHADSALGGGAVFYNVRLPRFHYWVTSQLVFRMNRFMLGHYVLWGSNMALPATLWRKVQPHVCLRTDIHEDLDLAIHLHRLGYKITYLASLRVGVEMRRVYSNVGELWSTMMLWPQTLRKHDFWTWPLSWLGAFLLFAGSPIVVFADWLARAAGRPKLTS